MALPILRPVRRRQGGDDVVTAADLIRSGACTSACIAAVTGTNRCTCPCAGEHHGLLSRADISALIDARRHGLHRLTDGEIVAGDYLEVSA